MKKEFLAYFFVKVFYILFGIFVFSKVSALGDSDRYVSANSEVSADVLLNRTQLVDVIAGTITKIFKFPFFTHLFFTFISFYGLVYCLSRLRSSKKQLLGVLIMLSLPSFCMWSSVAGKEALVVFTTGVILGTLFDTFFNKKIDHPFLFIACVLLSLLLRPHYSIGLIVFFFFVFFTKKMRFSPIAIFFSILFIFVICSYIFITIVKPFVESGGFIELAWAYFNGYGDAGAARNTDFWKVGSDYYTKIIQGSFIALIGPTFFDSLKRPVYFPFFFESMIFIFYCGYFVYIAIKLQIKKSFFSQYFFFGLFFVIILTSIMHYPFGVFNSGSALRYRTAFYHIFIILPVFLYNYLKNRERETVSPLISTPKF